MTGCVARSDAVVLVVDAADARFLPAHGHHVAFALHHLAPAVVADKQTAGGERTLAVLDDLHVSGHFGVGDEHVAHRALRLALRGGYEQLSAGGAHPLVFKVFHHRKAVFVGENRAEADELGELPAAGALAAVDVAVVGERVGAAFLRRRHGKHLEPRRVGIIVRPVNLLSSVPEALAV